MSKPLKPMLAKNAPEKINFPVWMSPKLDGIRTLITEDGAMSRKLLSIPNQFVQDQLTDPTLIGLDGELIVGSPCSKSVFNLTSSGVMSEDGAPDFTFYVFDFWSGLATTTEWRDRWVILQEWFTKHKYERVVLLEQTLVHNEQEMLAKEQEYLDAGFEGAMIKSPHGPYKYGRSTEREGYLLKVKRFTDSEAVIVGFEELMHNENEATEDAMGHTKRSSHKANKVAGNTLGSLIVKDIKTDVEFNIGSGFDASLRQKIWSNQNAYLNSVVKYKHFEIGSKDKPRFPIFMGFRHPIDM